ncbi:Metallo-dependent phosphatase-like protein [Fennellomyces sp. T-0311]|nr:Metallo-dependent phosphatase-like protein [Fennellomyces sp. T-0311]
MNPTDTTNLSPTCGTEKRPTTHRRLWRYITAFSLTALVILCGATVHGKAAIQVTPNGTKHFYKRSLDTSGFDVQTRDIGDKSHLSIYANLVPMISINNDPFFETANVRRLFAVGDVHGCLKEFNELLAKIEYDYELGDRLILLGDLVNKGPDSVGVVRRANELKALCVRGNHDNVLIRIMGYLRGHNVRENTKSGKAMPEGPVVDPILFSLPHWEIARQMTQNDYEYLASCPLILGIPGLNSLFVHGGVDPRKSLQDQIPFFVMSMRGIDLDGTPTSGRNYLLNWSDEWNLFQLANMSAVEKPFTNVYYGHDSVRGLQLKTNTFGLDSGCVFGGQLSALELKSGQLTQIQCGTYAKSPTSK